MSERVPILTLAAYQSGVAMAVVAIVLSLASLLEGL